MTRLDNVFIGKIACGILRSGGCLTAISVSGYVKTGRKDPNIGEIV